VAHLQAALDYASAWTGKRVVASFADLLRTIAAIDKSLCSSGHMFESP
jgi:hypothetical protein